jgi:glucoamylase
MIDITPRPARIAALPSTTQMTEFLNQAPGAPGIAPRWTSSAKTGVGTALTANSQVWFTLSHGILNEIYYPRTDFACTRDLGLIVTAAGGFFSEEKRHTQHETHWFEHGVPAFELINTCQRGRYRIHKCVITDPHRDVVLQHIRFEVLQGEVGDYRLFVLLAPHLVNGGYDNSAWLGEHKGDPMLFAEGGGTALALASSQRWRQRSAGFVGCSDGWQDLMRNGQLTQLYTCAEHGNVALCGELDIAAAAGAEGITLALGFGHRPSEAAHLARASLQSGFETAFTTYVADWRECQQCAHAINHHFSDSCAKLYHSSIAMMLAHETAAFPGAVIASLSIPWGFAKGEDDLGGYHLVWPRELVLTAGGLLAAGLHEQALAVLNYLQTVQEQDGSWPQNMWLDGTFYWSGMQLDQTAFPILLVDLIRRSGHLSEDAATRYLPLVRRAAAFIVRNGPVTGQDRWEENSGYSPFSLAVAIAALLAAADILEARGDSAVAAFLRASADCWNDNIENWMYVADTPLARAAQVDGYYVRIAPPTQGALAPTAGTVTVKNRGMAPDLPAAAVVSPDALALVRFGLRAADDPRIRNTVKVIDQLLRIDLPAGPVWHRYNEDGYGEHADGQPFDGSGIGRGWPLLTGERAHYEIARGDTDTAQQLLHAMRACASAGGLLPEQVWDSDDIPERELLRGRPSGSAMPLLWAHAEYIKLMRSLQDGRVFDMPLNTVQRYIDNPTRSTVECWRPNPARPQFARGKTLRIELDQPARVHWSIDNWRTVNDSETLDSGLGVFYFDAPTTALQSAEKIVFTLFWTNTQNWLGRDFAVSAV